jgi:hypothetical protein
VLGPRLIAVHELFDRIAREAESYSYLITERNAGLGAGQSRSRPSKLSLPLSPAGSPTKANTSSRSPRRLPHSRNRPARLSDDLRRSATLIPPISSSRYIPTRRRSALLRRIASLRRDMTETADFAKTRQASPTIPRKSRQLRSRPNTVATGSGADAVDRSRSTTSPSG